MKNIHILLVALLFSAFSMQAATLIVNNATPTVAGEYTTVDAAIAAAADNDIILIKGTVTSYGAFTVTKPLSIVGNGYKPATVSANSSKCDYIYLTAGIHNIKILGMDCQAISPGGDNDKVTVEFCKISTNISNIVSTCQDWVISNCIFSQDSYSYIYGDNPTNVLIEHCIISGGIRMGSSATNIVVQYNVFAHSNSYTAFGPISNAVIVNNIFYDSYLIGSNGYLGDCTFTGCIIANNLTYSSGGTNNIPTNTGNNTGNSISANIANTNPNFRNYPAAGTGFDFTQDFRLLPGSAALTAGSGSTQIGLYGGGFTFSTTGEPRIPAVRSINITNPSTNSGVGSTINVTVTASKARPN